MSVLNIGLGAFNLLERCEIVGWGRDFFLAIQVHAMQQPEDCLVMMGVALDADCYGKWQSLIPGNQPVLLLSERPVMAVNRPHLTDPLTLGDAKPLEAEISAWLLALSSSRPKVRVPSRPAAFSDRESAVLRLLADSAKNEAIVATVLIKSSTVMTHLRRVYDYLHAINRAHAASLYKSERPRTWRPR